MVSLRCACPDLLQGGKETVSSLYRPLHVAERQSIGVGYGELAGSLVVSVKINGLGNFRELSRLYTLTAVGYLKSY